MAILDIIKKNRSYRRFYEEAAISAEDLNLMVEAARYSASSRNIQPLKYYICNSKEMNAKIFPTLAWAGYLTEWDGPVEGERPSAYIVQLLDKNISATASCDHGITAQSMLLQAVELGFGGCIIASVKREALSAILDLPENLEIIQVLALGKPKEEIVVDDMRDNQFKYWREESGIHHVPKRRLEELIAGAQLQ
ncbi:MAG: nitroreductase family protein [Bacteroidales bacterium]|nr:nitroreductase family protein [Bacteroidales bacterium]